MKTFLIILCLSTAYVCEAQGKWDDTLVGKPVWKVKPLPLEGNNIVYTGNITQAGYNPDQLFKNALDWYNINYKSADTKLTVENKEQGNIAGSGVIHYNQQVNANGPQNIFFSFSIFLARSGYSYRFYDMYSMVNGERYKYSDMYMEELHNTASVKPHWTHKYRYESLMDMDSFMTLAINQLKKDMQKQ
jgi:Domain of unknown function (DUF4468) with TBP-like fold